MDLTEPTKKEIEQSLQRKRQNRAYKERDRTEPTKKDRTEPTKKEIEQSLQRNFIEPNQIQHY